MQHPIMLACMPSCMHTYVCPPLSSSVSLNRQNSQGGETPLHTAAGKGFTQGAETLLEAKANLQAVSAAGWTPLGLAERDNKNNLNAAVIAVLRKHGAKHPCSLACATREGKTETVAGLIADGADLHACDTPVHLLCKAPKRGPRITAVHSHSLLLE